MKNSSNIFTRHLLWLIFAAFTFGLFAVPTARAGLTVDIHLYHDNFGYYFYSYLNANTNPPDFPDGVYQVASPQIPTNGSRLIYFATNNTISECYNGDCGGGSYYGTFDDMMNGITNGQWSISVTNNTSTNSYFFAVQVTGLTSNIFGAPPQVVYPANGQLNVPNQPVLQWTGPAGWAGTLSVQDAFIDTNGYYNFVASENLSPDATSWTPGTTLPDGTNQFSVTYQSNITAMVTASQPTNTSGPISGWVSTATLEAQFAYGNNYNVSFVVGGASQSNLVANGGFETGDFTSWTLPNDDGSIFVDDGSSLGDTPHSGSYVAAFGEQGAMSYLAQTLPTTPGTTYLLSFWLNSPDGNTPNEFQVSWNGTVLFDETDIPALGWTNLQFMVTATGSSTMLQFGAQDDPSYLGLDDVSVVPLQAGGPVAHYDFDENEVLAPDVSGHGNNIIQAGDFGGNGPSISSDTVAGSGSISFDGGSYLTASSNLLSTLAGDFTVSLWLKTTQDNHDPNDVAWTGDAIVSADSPNAGAKDLIPVALTGGQVAFNVGDGNSDNTLNSSATVNDGIWHHVVVTRNQSTGERRIYIDGALDSSDFATTVLLNSPVLLTIGAKSDASNPDPASPDYNGSNGYDGLLDDIQIYDRVLSSDEVAFLHANPGATVAGTDFNAALNTTNLTWTTGGDAPWFVETTNTYDGVSAAQSGLITDGQTNWIETTVPADGELSFYWKVSSEDGWDYLTFYINGEEQDAISGEVDWNQETYSVSAGDVVRWEYTKDPDCCSSGADAGWLDQVVLPPGTAGGTSYPVDANLQFSIIRTQDPGLGEIYGGSVSFNSISPAPDTTNSVHSPHDYFNTEVYPGGGTGGGAILASLDQVINEFTNGVWTMYINQGSPTQQVYTFQASISGLDTNLLQAVRVFHPTNGAVNVATNPVFYWNGPTNFSTLQVDLLSGPAASLPMTATNWPSAPTLNYGPDRFDVDYNSNNFPGVTFTTPVDASANPVRTWAANVNLISQSFNNFVVGAPAPLPVMLTNLTRAGGNVQFSFQTLAGRPHYIQSRTNLTIGTWVNLTNFTGDGSLKQFSFPATNPPTQFFRVNTQ